MDKRAFLNELRRRLAALPSAERKRQLAYYAELIDDRIEDGKSETDAVAHLGDVQTLADSILQSLPPNAARRSPSTGSVVLLALSSPVWLPVLLALFITAWAVGLALCVTAFALLLAGVVAMVMAIPNAGGSVPQMLMSFGAGFILAALALFIGMGAALVVKALAQATAWLFRRRSTSVPASFESK